MKIRKTFKLTLFLFVLLHLPIGNGHAQQVYLDAHFDVNANGFEYLDDTFLSTDRPADVNGVYQPSGGYTGGGLGIRFGVPGVAGIRKVSGGWQTTFNLTQETRVRLLFRYYLARFSNYEDGEYSQVLVSLDGQIFGDQIDPIGHHYIDQVTHKGNGITGWQEFTFELGSLAAGEHSLIIGGYQNHPSNQSSGVANLFIDDVSVLESSCPNCEFSRFDEFNMQPEVWHFNGPEQAEVDAKGDLRLSIPILTVPGTPGRDYQVRFSYKAGILYHQTASWIGLGWNFDPGSISRDVFGVFADTIGAEVIFYGVDHEETETFKKMPDVYYLTLPGRGTFSMLRSIAQNFNKFSGGSTYLHPNSGDFGFYFEEYRPYMIEHDVWPVNTEWTGGYSIREDFTDVKRFTITTDDAVKYIFGLPSLAYYESSINTGAGSEFYPNAWRLLAIAGPDYAGDVELLLQKDGSETLTGQPELPEYTTLKKYVDWIVFEYGHDTPAFAEMFIPQNSRLIQTTFLKKITTPTHYADFMLGTRSDVDLQNQPLPDAGTYDISALLKNLSG